MNTVAPGLPLVDIRTMEQIVGERLAPDGFNIVLYGELAALALVLATLGIYAVMAFTVVQRTAEIGLRMALGAGHNQLQLQILREGATLVTGGLVLGLVGAYALGRAMQAMLFGTGALKCTRGARRRSCPPWRSSRGVLRASSPRQRRRSSDRVAPVIGIQS